MHYHVARNGHQMGQVEEAELKAGFLDGRYLPTDLVWRDGMAEWKPLGEMNWPGPGAPAPKEPTRVAGPRPEFLSKPGLPAPPRFAGAAPLPGGAPPASGLAVTSLVSGILSILACSVCGIGTLAAIICGHLALSGINRSGGTVGGRGMAITGLILGYASILVSLIGLSLALPAFSKIQEKGQVTLQISYARQAQVACMIYTTENEGKYPASLEELVEKGYLEAEVLRKAEAFKPSSWKGEPGFDYLGAGKDDTLSPDTPVLVSRAADKRGQRVVARHDGSVMLDKLE